MWQKRVELLLFAAGILLAVGSNEGSTNTALGNVINSASVAHDNASLNASGIEIHLFLELLQKTQKTDLDLALSDHTNFEHDLANVFIATLNGNWENSEHLIDFAQLTPNATVKLIIYEVLWRELQRNKMIYNPFKIIALYENLQTVIANIKPLKEALVFSALEQDIRQSIVRRSAQILEGALHLRNLSAGIELSTLYDSLLHEDVLQDDEIFELTIETLYDAVEELETPLHIAYAIGNYSLDTKRTIVANLKLLSRIENSTYAAQVRVIVQDNLMKIMSNDDFGKIPTNLREQVNALLPVSMRTLYSSQQVCIRNITNSQTYLYECPQTYLMCTNSGGDLKKAAFQLVRDYSTDRNFGFQSVFWSNRYVKMEGPLYPGNTTTIPEVRKNVYSVSNAIAAFWHVEFDGDFVSLLDTTRSVYLCGGNSSLWSGIEQHVYTRTTEQFPNYRQECLWLVEDCN